MAVEPLSNQVDLSHAIDNTQRSRSDVSVTQRHRSIIQLHLPAVSGSASGAAGRERSTVCRLVTSSMDTPLLSESVVRNSPLLTEVCSDAITCSGVIPSATLTVYASVTPDSSLRPLDVVVMSVTDASGTPSTEITLPVTASVKSESVVCHISIPVRV